MRWTFLACVAVLLFTLASLAAQDFSSSPSDSPSSYDGGFSLDPCYAVIRENLSLVMETSSELDFTNSPPFFFSPKVPLVLIIDRNLPINSIRMSLKTTCPNSAVIESVASNLTFFMNATTLGVNFSGTIPPEIASNFQELRSLVSSNGIDSNCFPKDLLDTRLYQQYCEVLDPSKVNNALNLTQCNHSMFPRCSPSSTPAVPSTLLLLILFFFPLLCLCAHFESSEGLEEVLPIRRRFVAFAVTVLVAAILVPGSFPQDLMKKCGIWVEVTANFNASCGYQLSSRLPGNESLPVLVRFANPSHSPYSIPAYGHYPCLLAEGYSLQSAKCPQVVESKIGDCLMSIMELESSLAYSCDGASRCFEHPSWAGRCCSHKLPEPNGSCTDGICEIDPMCYGRPYNTSAGYLTGDLVRSNESGWISLKLDDPSPSIHNATIRSERHAHWLRNALSEHSSVSSFASFSLQLMALGAPASLVQRAHLAALDEIRHAQSAFAIADYFDDSESKTIFGKLSPVGFRSKPHSIEIDGRDLWGVCSSVLREGCVEETISVFEAAMELQNPPHPLIQLEIDALSETVAEEAEHSRLAWDTISWCLDEEDRRGGSRAELYFNLHALMVTELNSSRRLKSTVTQKMGHDTIVQLMRRLDPAAPVNSCLDHEENSIVDLCKVKGRIEYSEVKNVESLACFLLH